MTTVTGAQSNVEIVAPHMHAAAGLSAPSRPSRKPAQHCFESAYGVEKARVLRASSQQVSGIQIFTKADYERRNTRESPGCPLRPSVYDAVVVQKRVALRATTTTMPRLHGGEVGDAEAGATDA